MKKCTRCKLEKIEEAFHRRSKDGGCSSMCIPCHRAYYKEYYQKNKTYYLLKAREQQLSLQRMINVLKDVPCADCGVRYPPCVMDFHHPNPADKEKAVGWLRRCGSVAGLVREIKKCIVLCANCHRIRTNSTRLPI